jgi:hypothetical protein
MTSPHIYAGCHKNHFIKIILVFQGNTALRTTNHQLPTHHWQNSQQKQELALSPVLPNIPNKKLNRSKNTHSWVHHLSKATFWTAGISVTTTPTKKVTKNATHSLLSHQHSVAISCTEWWSNNKAWMHTDSEQTDKTEATEVIHTIHICSNPPCTRSIITVNKNI